MSQLNKNIFNWEQLGKKFPVIPNYNWELIGNWVIGVILHASN
jgi:hypothetical protein